MPRSSRKCRTSVSASLVLFVAIATLSAPPAAQPEANLNSLTWSTDSVGPARFVSVHGRRAAVFGYSQDGLEVWAYPFQILRDYRVSFCLQGTNTTVDSQRVVRRIIYSPEAVTRIYAGSDFIVRERIFVPLDEAGAIFHYEVASARPLDIVIHFIPIMDLMWPGSIGGQEAIWDPAASAYLVSEPRHRFSASIGSPDMVAHDETPNENRQLSREPGSALTIRAGGDHTNAQVIVAGGPERSATAMAKGLQEKEDSLEKLAADHYTALLNNVLQIETPDDAVNRALAWSEIALDQAWVCNPDLGCGLVAGYGPSRKARRPQYDWFFAGDGMVDLPALLAAGQYDRAREELEFILKYQDQKTGIIWHELSQSAGWIDWSKYPYMFVHVELTFDFLDAVENYFNATADRKFVAQHWPAIRSAYNYCRSLVDPSDGLPRIPADKEGSREQESLSEELALSANWVAASQAFAELANATGHPSEGADAATANRNARAAIPRRYWDEKQNFWITGYTRSGAPLIDRQIGPLKVLDQGIFSPAQRDSILQQLASADYQADWGARGRSSSSSSYDANSYANGSAWATSTSAVASAFWDAHRPATAFPIWSALVPWSSLDSLGHMHETLAGDYYHEQAESVPEQTWSSATFFAAAVTGLFGLNVDAVSDRVNFAPHLPPNWEAITIHNLRVGSSKIGFNMVTSSTGIRLQMQNEGNPVKVTFDPELPLGAKLRGARLQDRSITVTLEAHPQDTHAKMGFDLPHGDSMLTIEYTGGVEILPQSAPLMVGDPSEEMKLTKINLQGQLYTVDFDYLPSGILDFALRTTWFLKRVQGATCKATSPNVYRCSLSVPEEHTNQNGFQHAEVNVTFAPTR